MKMKMIHPFRRTVLFSLLLGAYCNAFSVQPKTSTTATAKTHQHDNEELSLPRRKLLEQAVTGVTMAASAKIVARPRPAFAAAYAQEKEDKQKIAKGYERLSYLLQHWEAETTICQYSGKTSGCERSPINVMEYMGYKSTNDPLFKADKTLKRLSTLVDDDGSIEYIDAMEKWLQAAEEANGMAYVSSWGEANPGGGKDRVELFIERSKKNVMDARDALATAMDLLQMERP